MEKIKEQISEMLFESAYTAKDYKFNQEVPKGPNALAMYKWITKEIHEINEQIDDIEKRHGLHAICKKGCSACCSQGIVVSMGEVLPMEIYILNLSSEEKNKLRERVVQQCEQLEQNGIKKDSIEKCFGEQAQRRVQESYFSLQMPCVFLDCEGCCSIHEIRPTACWKYREYGSENNCEISCFSDTGVDFTDWESREFNRILSAKPSGKKLMLLPFAIRELMRW